MMNSTDFKLRQRLINRSGVINLRELHQHYRSQQQFTAQLMQALTLFERMQFRYGSDIFQRHAIAQRFSVCRIELGETPETNSWLVRVLPLKNDDQSPAIKAEVTPSPTTIRCFKLSELSTTISRTEISSSQTLHHLSTVTEVVLSDPVYNPEKPLSDTGTLRIRRRSLSPTTHSSLSSDSTTDPPSLPLVETVKPIAETRSSNPSSPGATTQSSINPPSLPLVETVKPIAETRSSNSSSPRTTPTQSSIQEFVQSRVTAQITSKSLTSKSLELSLAQSSQSDSYLAKPADHSQFGDQTQSPSFTALPLRLPIQSRSSSTIAETAPSWDESTQLQSFTHPSEQTAKSAQVAMPRIDLEKLAERVSRIIARKMSSEYGRRGLIR